jgi:hypothetical protein
MSPGSQLQMSFDISDGYQHCSVCTPQVPQCWKVCSAPNRPHFSRYAAAYLPQHSSRVFSGCRPNPVGACLATLREDPLRVDVMLESEHEVIGECRMRTSVGRRNCAFLLNACVPRASDQSTALH